MKLWHSDFFGSESVGLMSGPEQAAYLLALARLHQAGGYLSEDKLRRVMRYTADEWAGVRDAVVDALEESENDSLTHPRVLCELLNAQAISEARSNAVKRRWEKKRVDTNVLQGSADPDDAAVEKVTPDTSVIQSSERSDRNVSLSELNSTETDYKNDTSSRAHARAGYGYGCSSSESSSGSEGGECERGGGQVDDATVTRVVERWERVVCAPRSHRDQTRTSGRANVTARLLDGFGAEQLELAIDRYAEELDDDARPLGLRSFFGDVDRLRAFLADDWRPPAAPARKPKRGSSSREASSGEDWR